MLECDYEVKQIDGDYAHLQRIDRPEEELKLVARRFCRWRFMRDVSFIMR